MDQTDAAVDFLFGYAGRPWDAQTGLYDNRARWYDPAVGRFLSEDPSGFAGGQDLNLYRYVGNNPWTNTDPSGLCDNSINAAAQSTLSYGYSSGYASSTGSSYFPSLSYDVFSGASQSALSGYTLSDSSSLPSVSSVGTYNIAAPNPVADVAVVAWNGASAYASDMRNYGSAYLIPPSRVDAATLPQAQIANAARNAELSVSVYDVHERGYRAPAGYQTVGAPVMDGTTGFKAQLYQDTTTKKYVLAFAGTDDRPDVVNDVQQATIFRAAQYDQAIRLAEQLKRVHGYNLSFTGHSLGGGLAAAAAMATQLQATTFNPAGVNPDTLRRNNVPLSRMSDQSNIAAFAVRGEALTTAQDYLVRGLPVTNGTKVAMLDAGPYSNDSAELHRMGAVLFALDMLMLRFNP